jgi:exopolyphosphatase / guanosine-5'-triphosphate,3'-diphosphate pyrophosphatase
VASTAVPPDDEGRDAGTGRTAGEVHAAIDVGTNSIHLVVARTSPSGRFDVLAQEKEVVRLGSGSGDMKQLTGPAMDRGVDTLRRFRQVTEIWAADVTAVATSAVREAVNRDHFVERARQEAGVEVEVISGVEEARLIRLGVLQAVPVYADRHLITDIGGGSTEFVLGEADGVLACRSIKLGAVRLTERFFSEGGRPSADAVTACRQHLRTYLNHIVRDVAPLGFSVAVGSSGTIENIAQMAVLRRPGKRQPATLNALSFERDEVDAVTEEVLAAGSAKARSRIAGLDPRRVDIIVAGALLLQQIFVDFGIPAMTVSAYALREGVLVDQMRRAALSTQPGADPRWSSVEHMVAQFDPDPAHSAQATELALDLFDQTVPLHGLDGYERDILRAAGRLHNVGLLISHASHHKHSYYVIRNSELLSGFNDHELELIAQVARYHRKSEPRAKHPEYALLSSHDQQIVRVLAGILRVAISLDRTHADVVGSLHTEVDTSAGSLRVVPCVRAGADASLELYTARERRHLLAEALGVEVAVAEPTPA